MMLVRQGLEQEATQFNGEEGTPPVRVGFITPWNQACGLATYASFLVPHLSKNTVAIFAEGEDAVAEADASNVIRCWKRVSDSNSTPSYARLESVLESSLIDVLHINCQARFFAQPLFSSVLGRVRARGVKVVIHLHQLFTLAPENAALIQAADHIVVHSEESKLEAIAHGAHPAAVSVLPHGVFFRPELVTASKEEVRTKLGLPVETPLVSAFGFIQPHKGMEGVIEAVAHLRSRGIPARGLVIGETRSDDPRSAEYLATMKELAARYGLADHISFITRYISDREVGEYLAASDLVVMNYRSNYFEASGACSLAVGVGAVVMASLAPALMGFGSSVWHLTGGYPVGLSAELLLSNRELVIVLRSSTVLSFRLLRNDPPREQKLTLR
jgi:O-antigen biosynthesis alpha-1,2-mannosyltransferase